MHLFFLNQIKSKNITFSVPFMSQRTCVEQDVKSNEMSERN